MVVRHNLTAMNANRMLGMTQSSQAKSSEKLSSGYRINRAADDAAGLSISEKMRKQIKGLDKASSNAQDGVSAVQTAEGALTEVHSMLQRMNELAVQASNGTNSEDDRAALQAEIDQLVTEIDRVAETTKFNETYLLKGDAGTKTINMEAHDAGLKGKLVDNGDGTATFTMDELKAGDKVSIGGREYTIVEDKDANKGTEKTSKTDMNSLLTEVYNKATNSGSPSATANTSVKIKVGEDVYEGAWNASLGTPAYEWKKNGAVDATITAATSFTNLVEPGTSVEIEVDGDELDIYNGTYEVETTVANVQTEVDNLLSSAVDDGNQTAGTPTPAGKHDGTTITIIGADGGERTYTFTDPDGTNSATGDTKWLDEEGKDVTNDIADLTKVKEGDIVKIDFKDSSSTGSTAYVQNFNIPEAKDNSGSTEIKTEITAKEAYELARQELYAANSIGDTKGTADVTFGKKAADKDTVNTLSGVNEAIQDAFNNNKLSTGDTITIDSKVYTYDTGKWYNDEGAEVTNSLSVKANSGDVVKVSIKKDTDASKNYQIESTLKDVQNLLNGVKDLAGSVTENDTITINGKTYTRNATAAATATDSGWTDSFGDTVALTDWDEITTLKEGDTVSFAVEADSAISGTYVIPTTKNTDPAITSSLFAGEAQNVFTIQTGSAEVQNTLTVNLHVGSDADMTNKIQIDVNAMSSDYLGVKGLNVQDDTGVAATYAIDAIQDAIQKVSSQRSSLGAVQNRLEHTIDNLDNVVENTTAAESRIRDTDMAKEMVEFSKTNILAQAGQSILAQANQSTQGILSLLG